MLKKITFFLVLLFGLYIASVTAYAANTDSTAPDALSVSDSESPAPTQVAANTDFPVTDNTTGAYDEAVPSVIPNKVKSDDASFDEILTVEEEPDTSESNTKTEITDYAGAYGDVFFDPQSATDDLIISMKKYNHNDFSSNPLSYVLSGSVVPNADDPSDSPVVILYYIKHNGQFVPLNLTDIKDRKTNMLEKDSPLIVSYVDLLYLGADKSNEVRIIAFRKEDANNLVLGENLQVKNLSIVVRKNIIEGVPFIVNIVLNSLDPSKN